MDGTAYLSGISDGIPLAGNMMYTARRLREMAACREAISTADFIMECASQQEGSPAHLFDMAIYTDLDQLDKIIGGFRAGELVIVKAETGSGKTLLAQQTRARACRDEFHSLFCSGEMLAPHLKRRAVAAAADVAPRKIRREDLLTTEDRHALVEAASHECKKCRILDGELNLVRIRRAARKMKKQAGLDLEAVEKRAARIAQYVA